jgi:hypothetical protein
MPVFFVEAARHMIKFSPYATENRALTQEVNKGEDADIVE